MPSNVEITIPTATLTGDHTTYNITIRLPLRSLVVQKRYSEFVSFHEELVYKIGAQPPVPLPKKSWFHNTNSNERLREERRQGLEKYLQAINNADDQRWRNTSIWRSFLNLPSQAAAGENTSSARLHKAATGPGGLGSAPITDPVLWLDCHRELKSHLHDARLHLTRRDQATTPQKQHESSAHARSSLAKAEAMITALEDGLKNPGGGSNTWAGSGLGEGEVRRRKDLLASAKKERDGLENLHNAMMQKSRLDSAVASIQDKDKLVNSRKPRLGGGRVLGKETDKTRELDNQGVLQLQRQTMEAQDKSVDDLLEIVSRQRELGIAINNELEIQNELLNLTDEDVTRLQSKIDVGNKRVGKIS